MDDKTTPTPQVCCLYCNQPSHGGWAMTGVIFNVCPPCAEKKDIARNEKVQLELALNVIEGLTDTENGGIDELMRGLVKQRFKHPEVTDFTLLFYTDPGKPGLWKFFWRPEQVGDRPVVETQH